MINLLPDAAILFQWVIFMIAVFTLHFGIFRPTLKIIEMRRSKTTGAKEKADALSHESESMVAFVEKKMESARLQGLKLREERRMAGNKATEETIKKTRQEIDQKLDALRQDIEKAARQASIQLQQQAHDMAREIASRVLERGI